MLLQNNFFKTIFLLSALLTLVSTTELNQSRVEDKKIQRKIKIAIIDTGVDVSHSLLKNLNWDESYDFVTDSNTIVDGHGHGTHVAGLIASRLQGVRTDAPNFQFLSLRYYSLQEPTKNLERSKKALAWAIEKNVDVINYSGGGSSIDVEEYALLKKAERRGIVVVTSAGNNGTNKNKFYPAAYDLNNLIRVASVDKNNELSKFSNYGVHQADYAALGEDMNSSLPGNRWGVLSGTSQATAVMTAAIASLILETHMMRQNRFIILKKSLNTKTRYISSLESKLRFPRVL